MQLIHDTRGAGKYLCKNRSHPFLLTYSHLGSPSSNRALSLRPMLSCLINQSIHQVRVGRIAGQYAKPRSSPIEKIGDREVPSFR